MRHGWMVMATCALAALGVASGAELPRPARGTSIVVLPIAAEEEGLGEHLGLMLRNKARRLGAVVYDPTSVTDALEGRNPTVETSPEELRRLARDLFLADVVVVGRAEGVDRDYRIRIVAVHALPDRAGGPGSPGFDKTYVCGYHQIIPQEMAKAVREVLGLSPEPASAPPDPEAERRWREGPNLVRNPGFEAANEAGTGPAHWQPLEGQMEWAPDPDGAGKVLKFRMKGSTAVTYGLDYYSDWIAIEPHATYRFSCRVKSMGPALKIFLKGYHAFPPMEGYPAQRRETYRRQVHPKSPRGEWQTVEATFIPGATRPEHLPAFLKVDLYAYLSAGVVYWDDVVLKKVKDAPKEDASPTAPGDRVRPHREPSE